MITDKTKTPTEIWIQEDYGKKEYGVCQNDCVRGMVKYIREDMVPTHEEMLELAKRETFRLDDRLVPFDRETLRAEAWLSGYYFVKRHQMPLVVDHPIMVPDEDRLNKALDWLLDNAANYITFDKEQNRPLTDVRLAKDFRKIMEE